MSTECDRAYARLRIKRRKSRRTSRKSGRPAILFVKIVGTWFALVMGGTRGERREEIGAERYGDHVRTEDRMEKEV